MAGTCRSKYSMLTLRRRTPVHACGESVGVLVGNVQCQRRQRLAQQRGGLADVLGVEDLVAGQGGRHAARPDFSPNRVFGMADVDESEALQA